MGDRPEYHVTIYDGEGEVIWRDGRVASNEFYQIPWERMPDDGETVVRPSRDGYPPASETWRERLVARALGEEV